MIITILTLIFAATFFAWGKIRSDVVALIALITLSISGILTTEESLSGFSNSIVIMMIGLFVVGGAIFQTGLAKMIGARLLKLAGDSELRLFLLVVGVTSIIGAFVSNTGTVALMLPIVVSIANGGGIGTSRFLMPLAFASSMGGMMTLIGTPPNLVIEETLTNAGFERLTFFSFLPAGIVCLIIGTLLLIPLSKWFLRKNNSSSGTQSGNKSISQLVEEYNLNTNIQRIYNHNTCKSFYINGLHAKR
ncbi:MAG: SLC13/DASS family transporter [Muribaculaceae bacterium]|nr:SLC13/DASS family transporter [Muribaculaceae bacterium]